MFFINDYKSRNFIAALFKLLPDRTASRDVVMLNEEDAFRHAGNTT
jgi:hypothetical protein